MQHLKLIANLLFVTLFALNLNGQTKEVVFTPNEGQWDGPFQFKTNIPGGHIFFTPTQFVYNYFDLNQVNAAHEKKHDNKNVDISNEVINTHAFKVSFINANTASVIKPINKIDAYANFILGNDESKWKGNVAQYSSLKYNNLYNGVDLVVKSASNSMEYDFVVAPFADVTQIQLSYDGVSPKLLKNGNLSILTSVNEYEEAKPYAYQIIDGQKVEVPCAFVLKKNELSFKFLKAYDKAYELIIDPILVFKTYSGGSSTTFGWSATYDLTGKLYSGGECFGVGWPVSTGAYQTTFGGSVDVGLNVYSSNGSTLFYSTYFGGSGTDVPSSMIVEPGTNNVYIFGTTSSSNLPFKTGCYDSILGGFQDMYVAKINSTGTTLLASTYLGGSGNDGKDDNQINLTNNNEILLASVTSSSDFPVSTTALQSTTGGGTNDGIFSKLNNGLTALLYSTYIGGSSFDYATSAYSDNLNNIYICGTTGSSNFPVTTGCLQPTFGGGSNDGFLVKLNSSYAVQSVTYLGGSGDEESLRIQLDGNNDPYICGTNDNPVSITPTAGLYSNPGGNLTIHHLNQSLSTVIQVTKLGSTVASSTSFLNPCAFLLDVCGNIYISAFSASSNLPLTPNAIQSVQSSLYIMVLDGAMVNLLFGTYMGGSGDHIDGGSSRFDPNGIIYQSVCTANGTAYSGFPGAYSPNKVAGSWDIASFKIDFQFAGVNAIFNVGVTDTFCNTDTITFTNTSLGSTFFWDFGDGSTDTVANPKHIYPNGGTYNVMLVSYTTGQSCGTNDTFYKTLIILERPEIQPISDSTTCVNSSLAFDASINNPSSGFQYKWLPANYLSNSTLLNPTLVNPALSNTYTLTVGTQGKCASTYVAPITVLTGFNFSPSKDSICDNDVLNVVGTGHPKYTFTWNPTTALAPSNTVNTQIGTLPTGTYVYTLTATYPTCPDSSKTVTLTVLDRPKIILPNDTAICIGDTLNIFPNVTPNLNWYSYKWFPSAAVTAPFNKNTTFKATTTTNLILELDNNGCSKTYDTVRITINPKKNFVGETDTAICAGEVVQLNTALSSFSIAPLSNYTINAANPQQILFSPNTTTTYSITTNEYCVDKNLFTYQVNVSPIPVANINSPTQLWHIFSSNSFSTNATGNVNYTWKLDGVSYSTGNTVTLSNLSEGKHCLKLYVNDILGCADSNEYCFTVYGFNQLSFPNAFSPNGDNNNETWQVVAKLPQEVNVKIFNRWGALITTLKSTDEKWDGKYKGESCEMGTYFYIATYDKIDGTPVTEKGEINLLK
jgi:gliding motility-associated-like protein